MYDRIPSPGKEGRVLITPEDGSPPFYATIAMADDALQDGTELGKKTLLTDPTAARFGMGQDAVPDDVLEVLSRAAYDNVGDIRVTRRTDLGEAWLPCDGSELPPDRYPELTPHLEPVSNTVFFDEEFSYQYTGSLTRSDLLVENGVEMFLLGDDAGNYIVYKQPWHTQWSMIPAPAAVSNSVIRWVGDRFVFLNDTDTTGAAMSTINAWTSSNLLYWEKIELAVENIYLSSSNTYTFRAADLVYGDGHYMLVLKRKNGESDDPHPYILGFSDRLEGPYDLGNKNYGAADSTAGSGSYANGYFFFAYKPGSATMTLYSVKAAEAAHAGVVSVGMETGLGAAVQPSPVFYVSGRYWVGIAGDLFALDAPGGAVTPYSMDTARYNFSMSYDADSGRLLAASKTSSSASAAGFSMSVFDPTAGALVFSYLNKAEDTKYNASILAPRGNPLVMIVNTAAATRTVSIRRYRGYESRHIPLLTFDEVSAYIKAWQPDTFAGI